MSFSEIKMRFALCQAYPFLKVCLVLGPPPGLPDSHVLDGEHYLASLLSGDTSHLGEPGELGTYSRVLVRNIGAGQAHVQARLFAVHLNVRQQSTYETDLNHMCQALLFVCTPMCHIHISLSLSIYIYREIYTHTHTHAYQIVPSTGLVASGPSLGPCCGCGSRSFRPGRGYGEFS